ncbi:hypothetical protein GJ496_005897 [Pomphorhynchus laevis]|nr:hypothetical protein GJ496_005897 [Pomphorhynchus laevis]
MPTAKRLKDMFVAELRRELHRRNLDSSGTKQIMLDRLKKALMESNEDLDAWRYYPNDSEQSLNTDTVSKAASMQSLSDSAKVKCDESSSQRDHDNQSETSGFELSSKENVSIEKSKLETELLERSIECSDSILISADDEKITVSNENNTIEEDLVLDEQPSHNVSVTSQQAVVKNTAEFEKKTSRSSSPAIECPLVVGMADGTSELDRELLDFQGSNSNNSLDTKLTSSEGAANKVNQNESELLKERADIDKASSQVWVNNISVETKAMILKSIFSKHGKVKVARIVKKSYLGGSRLCGYVEMFSQDEADKAICALHKTSLNGNLIFCVRGDKKRTEDIISQHRKESGSLPEQIKVCKQIDASDNRTSTSKHTTALDPKRKDEKSNRKNAISLGQQTYFIERKSQMLKVLDRRVRRREFAVRHNEAKLREVERQYHIKLKELEAERDILREARTRFAREREEHERRNEEKVTALRAYEQRLIKAEAELRAAQEQQQRYYEAERLRQQKLAAYDEELKHRHELSQRRSNRRDKSASPARRRSSMIIQHDDSPKQSRSSFRRHADREDESAERYWSGDRNRSSNWAYSQNSSAPMDSSRSSGRRNFSSSRMSFIERDTTPPRKLKKTVDYHRPRIDQSSAGLDGSTATSTDTDLRRGELSASRYSYINEGNQSWRQHQQRSSPTIYRSSSNNQQLSTRTSNKLSDSGQQRRHHGQYVMPSTSSSTSVPRFDAYTLMVNELARATAGSNSVAAAAALSAYSNPQLKYQSPGSFNISSNVIPSQQSSVNSSQIVDRQRYG